MTTDIIRKLEAELNAGITTEAQVVYLMTGLRKLLEQPQAKKQYEYLTFHCDWALHSKLQGTTAQKILEQFDRANIHLKTGIKLRNLPADFQREIYGISKMEWFREELSTFLAANGLPGLERPRDSSSRWLDSFSSSLLQSCRGLPARNDHQQYVGQHRESDGAFRIGQSSSRKRNPIRNRVDRRRQEWPNGRNLRYQLFFSNPISG